MSSCRRCAAPGSPVDVCGDDGNVIASGSMCDSCFATASAEAAGFRAEFEALLAAGMSREEANARMIQKIEGRGARA